MRNIILSEKKENKPFEVCLRHNHPSVDIGEIIHELDFYNHKVIRTTNPSPKKVPAAFFLMWKSNRVQH